MKPYLILTAAVTLAGCNVTSQELQRTFNVGPYKYCGEGHTCFQAGETWEFYPFAEGDATRFAEEGRACWAESNRANWDSCTHRVKQVDKLCNRQYIICIGTQKEARQ